MQNIIILGSTGNIGKYFVNIYKKKYNIFADSKFSLSELLNPNFLDINSIDCVINCIGSIRKDEFFFHANFFVPLYLSKTLIDFSNRFTKKIKFIHLSSIGVNDPYGKMSLKLRDLNIDSRENLNFDKYEFSKCCADYHLKFSLAPFTNIKLYLVQPSIVIFKDSPFLKKLLLFLIICPLKIPYNSKPPFSRIEKLIAKLEKIIEEDKITDLDRISENIFLLQFYERIKLTTLFPIYRYISLMKITISKNLLLKILNYLSKIHFLSPIIKTLKFLIFL